jgi:hypothetical protein
MAEQCYNSLSNALLWTRWVCFAQLELYGMNYCTPYPIARRRLGLPVPNAEYFTPVTLSTGNGVYSVVKLPIHALPLADGLKIQGMDREELTRTDLKMQPTLSALIILSRGEYSNGGKHCP